jgi:hypothetical protein
MGETQLAKEIPKALKPFRSVKGSTHMGSKYLVRIIDERARVNSLPGFGGAVFNEIKYASQPTLSLAWYLPNSFEAEWNSFRISFRVELFKEGKKPRWAIASLTVEPLKADKPLGKVEQLPLDTFLKEAIHLATLQCITYPPGYEGAMLGLDGSPLPGWQGWQVSVPATRKEGEQYPIAWLSETPRDILQEFVATATDLSQRKQLSTEKRLAVVAKAWKRAPERGKASAVQKELAEVGDVVGLERVKQLIGDAREAGLIPPSERGKK